MSVSSDKLSASYPDVEVIELEPSSKRQKLTADSSEPLQEPSD